jgi:hypothetical protein
MRALDYRGFSVDFAQAQKDMRHAHFSGAFGVLVSGLVWLTAGIVALSATQNDAMATLFIGGMCIHPVAVALCKLAGRPGGAGKGHPLTANAMEVTALFVLCMPFAYVCALNKPAWFFPGMLLLIGARYLTFRTLFGMKIYGRLGIALIAAGFALIWLQPAFVVGPFTGAAIELMFAPLIIGAARREAVGIVAQPA